MGGSLHLRGTSLHYVCGERAHKAYQGEDEGDCGLWNIISPARMPARLLDMSYNNPPVDSSPHIFDRAGRIAGPIECAFGGSSETCEDKWTTQW